MFACALHRFVPGSFVAGTTVAAFFGRAYRTGSFVAYPLTLQAPIARLPELRGRGCGRAALVGLLGSGVSAFGAGLGGLGLSAWWSCFGERGRVASAEVGAVRPVRFQRPIREQFQLPIAFVDFVVVLVAERDQVVEIGWAEF